MVEHLNIFIFFHFGCNLTCLSIFLFVSVLFLLYQMLINGISFGCEDIYIILYGVPFLQNHQNYYSRQTLIDFLSNVFGKPRKQTIRARY